jgi:hypothetical protein
MCKAYARKALFWNRGNYLDVDLPDFHAHGLRVLGVSAGTSLDEVLAAFREYIEPQISSNPPSEVASEVLEDQETLPCGIQKTSSKPEYALSYDEYLSLKRIVRPSDLRLAAGRLAGYKKRGDIDGFLNTLHQISEGKRLSVGGNRTGYNGKKRRLGSFIGGVMSAALVGASSALEAAARVSEFLYTGSLDGTA